MFRIFNLTSIQQANKLLPPQDTRNIMQITTFTTTIATVINAQTDPTSIESEPVNLTTEMFGGPMTPDIESGDGVVSYLLYMN